MPEFHADERAHQDWKRQVMSGEIQLEELETDVHKDRYGKTLEKVGPAGATQAAE